ncbi:transcription factor ATOH1-like [Clytia hemisphaerica]|uniref:transcription factor ATOH1-like n=1 Tax=Clytia hemisphaerica TaxID=252671 RepID=UPI0034D5ACFC|eukprot:TCONS_00017211-protein
METMNYIDGSSEMAFGGQEPYPYTNFLNNCQYQETDDMNNSYQCAYGSNYQSDFSDSSELNCDEFDDVDCGGIISGAKNSNSAKLDRVKRIVDNSGRKRRIYSTIHNDPKQSTRRFRANDRERRRMNSLNGALQALKGCVPSYHGKKRLTKLQILKFACHYISDLSDILCTEEDSNPQTNYPEINNNISNTTELKSQTNFNTADAFSNIMAATGDQQRNMMDQEQQIQSMPIDHNSVNGLSMLQRLEYLTFHSYMAAMTDGNENLNLPGVSDTSSNPDFFPINGVDQPNLISPNNNHIYNY